MEKINSNYLRPTPRQRHPFSRTKTNKAVLGFCRRILGLSASSVGIFRLSFKQDFCVTVGERRVIYTIEREYLLGVMVPSPDIHLTN